MNTKKEKVWIEIISTINHNKYKHVLLNNKYLRHSKDIIQSEDRGIETYETKKFHCHALMTKYIFKAMDVINILLVIRVNLPW